MRGIMSCGERRGESEERNYARSLSESRGSRPTAIAVIDEIADSLIVPRDRTGRDWPVD